MPRYRIQHRIKTLAELWNPFEYRGFTFSHWNFTVAQGPISDAWIAETTVEDENANKAFLRYREQLIPAVDRIAFVSQCFASLEYESFAIWRTDRDDGALYFRHSREVDPVPLHFDEDQRASLVALERYEEKGDVFRLLRESGSASTFYTRLAMLLSSLEAIAGERKTNRFLTTDKSFIENQILKDKVLYKDLFAYGTGVRNKLLHGTKVI